MPLRVPVTVIVLAPELSVTLFHFATSIVFGVVLPIVTPLMLKVTDDRFE